MSHIRRSSAWSASLLGGTLWTGVIGHAQGPTQLSGSVLDASGLPLVGATVTLRGAADSVTKTNIEGQFDFRAIPKASTN